MSEKITSLKDALLRIEELEKQLKVYTESPFVDTYITIKGQIDSFNEQLTITDEQITRSYTITTKGVEEVYSSTIAKGKIDLFADKDSKEFDRGWKYLNECVDLNMKLDALRKLMSPEQIKEADKKVGEQKVKRRVGMAENIAMNGNK